MEYVQMMKNSSTWFITREMLNSIEMRERESVFECVCVRERDRDRERERERESGETMVM